MTKTPRLPDRSEDGALGISATAGGANAVVALGRGVQELLATGTVHKDGQALPRL